MIAPNFSYIYISTMELYPTPVSYRYYSVSIQFYQGIRMRLNEILTPWFHKLITTLVVQQIHFYYVFECIIE